MSAMYLQNKYTRWYYNIITRAQSRILNEPKETHHILPKCLGGDDSKDNLVQLTCKEHFLCHYLLTKMVIGEPKLLYAAWAMANLQTDTQKRYKVTGKTYEILRRSFCATKSRYMKLHNPMANDLTKVAHAEAIKRRGKTKGTTGLKLGPKSSETRQKISRATTKSMTAERKSKIRQQQLNRSQELQLKYQIAHSPQISCLYCKQIFRPGTFWRWHGNNCKFRKS